MVVFKVTLFTSVGYVSLFVCSRVAFVLKWHPVIDWYDVCLNGGVVILVRVMDGYYGYSLIRDTAIETVELERTRCAWFE